jgi:D-alanyl-D-alanine dipeptidase
MITNISKHFCLPGIAFIIFLTGIVPETVAQTEGFIRPPVTDKMDDYNKQVKSDSDKKMVELKKMIPTIIYDLRYASTNNFMKRPMYPAKTNVTFLRRPAVGALQKIQQELRVKGLGLKIFDAYRPYSVTVKFWELVKDERYVANPSKGSGHNRGIAVDLTIINLANGNELNMGTGFDNFSDTAHHNFVNLPEEVLQNRLLLKTVMEKYGFRAYENEWWHYSWSDATKFEILDIEFKKLKKEL